MECVDFLGEYDDLPFETFAAEMRAHYPLMLETLERERAAGRQAQQKSA